MNQKIDFLPESYRKKQKHHYSVRSRQIVCLTIIALLACGGWQQHRSSHQLEMRRDELQKQVQLVREKLDDPATLHQKLEQIDRQAVLLTQLNIQIPQTQFFSAVTKNLPPLVSLIQYQYSQTEKNVADTPKNSSEVPESQNAIEQDLLHLAEQRQKKVGTILLHGIANNDLLISRYLANLQGCSVFKNVQLEFVQAKQFQNHPMREFKIQLQIRSIEHFGKPSRKSSDNKKLMVNSKPVHSKSNKKMRGCFRQIN